MGIFHKLPFLATLLKIFASVVVFFISLLICFIGFIVFIMMFAYALAPTEPIEDYEYVYGVDDSANKFLSIRIDGVILGEEEENPLDFLSEDFATYGYKVKEQLYAAAKDPEIKGVILEIQSPGGTIYGSNAITDGVKYYQEETKRPVYAYVQGLAASGAYWSAVSTDKIYADYGSLVGSIGVIFGPFKYYDTVIAENGGMFAGGVITQNGVDTIYFTAGKYKDFGNPFRKLSEEEVRIVQKGINNEYDIFVNYVSSRRSINDRTIRDTIGALVYDNKMAQEYKMIDGTATKHESYEKLAERAGIKDGDYQVVREVEPLTTLEEIFQTYLPIKNSPVAKTCKISQSYLAYYGNVAELCP